MASNRFTPAEKRFDRAAWLMVATVLVFVFLTLATTIMILVLPTDGWQIPYNSTPPPLLGTFAGNWPTPLKAGDRVLAVNGEKVNGSEGFAPLPRSAAWQIGHTVTYSILRGGQRLEIPVTLHRLDLAGIVRSLWNTMRDEPMEWSWSLIAIFVFLLRPRSFAARLMFVAFVPDNAVTKLGWAATTISANFAPGPVFQIHSFAGSFWGYLFYPAIILLAVSFPQPIYPLTRWPRAVPALLFGVSLALSIITVVAGSDLLATVILVAEAMLLFLAFGWALVNTRKLAHNAIARAQGVWVLFGFALTIIPTLVIYLLGYSGFVDLNSANLFYGEFVVLILPVCLAIAITRYHLFDIYLIIRRTLQYTLLTGLLALVYFGAVILLQSLFGFAGLGAAGSGSSQTQDLAIVLSTLAIAGLFTPLRRRVQQFIDRRFFRGQYNADQVLARFAATARDEVAIEPLTTALVNAVEKTLQPEQTSLWLRSGVDR